MSRERKIWDGRGDRLSDARKTEFAGRAADDRRLGELHLRLLAHFGRQNAKRGWLRVSQTELAKGWDCSRSRVNVAIGELVEWKYIRKVEQARTRESFCYYQTLLDEPFEDDCEEGECSAEGTPPDAEGCSAEGTLPPGGGVPPREQGCSDGGNTSVPHAEHPPYIEHARTDFRRQAPIPPYPQRGKKRDFEDDEKGISALLGRVLANGVSVDVIERVFRPILDQRRLSTADKLATLTELGRRANGLEPEALDRAARDVLEADVKVVKAERLATAIATAIKAGARIVVKPGSAQWHRWLDHLDRYEPQLAAVARRAGVLQVRTMWPTKPKETGAAA
jgi:hypothetical protein